MTTTMKSPDFQWITPAYGFNANWTHISVPENARNRLIEMAEELVGTSGLVAVYIPLSTAEIYKSGPMHGRVVGAIRLLAMPTQQKVEDYYYDDWNESRRWPIGWPCKVAYSPDVAECPSLKDHVEHLHGPGTFPGYAKQFQNGPFKLELKMRERLNSDFANFEQLV